MIRTRLPSASSANAIASCEPIESPSGRAWEVIRKRCFSRIASRICSKGLGSLGGIGVIVSWQVVQVRIGLTFGLDIEHDPLDAVLLFDALVVEELERRHVLEPEAATDLAAEKRLGPFQRFPGFRLCFVVPDRRVEHARLLKIRRHLHPRDGEEADPRIVHFAGDQIRDFGAELVTDTIGAGALSHWELLATYGGQGQSEGGYRTAP